MNFESTKLPNTELVKKAYDFAVARVKKSEPITAKRIIDDMHSQIDNQILMTQMEGSLSIEERKKRAEQIENQRDQIIKQNMDKVHQQVEILSKQKLTGIVFRGNTYAGKGLDDEDQLIAASIMMDAVSTPIEFNEVKANFPEEFSTLLEEVIHSNVYRENVAEVSKTMSGTAKVFMLLNEMNNVKGLHQHVKSIKDMPVTMNRRVIADGFNMLKPLLGASKVADELYVKTFNEFNEFIESGMSLSFENGKVTLEAKDGVKGFVTKGPKNPGGPGGPANGNKPVVVDPKSGAKGGRKLF